MRYGDERLPARFWAKVKQCADTGCWLWTGSLNEKGYALFGWHRKTAKAHRISYSVLVGDVPEGLELDHFTCRARHCVNPAHLEPVPHRVNVARGNAGRWRRERTACKAGHEYTESNTRIARDASRVCRECERLRMSAARKEP